jgi:hypothetical protein
MEGARFFLSKFFYCNIRKQLKFAGVVSNCVILCFTIPAFCFFVTTLTLGSRPRQGFTRVRAKIQPRSRISFSRECKKVLGNEPSHSQVNSHVGSWSPNGLPNLQKAIARVKTQWLEDFFISLERY